MKSIASSTRRASSIAPAFPVSAGADCDAALRRIGASVHDSLWRCELALLAALLVAFNFPLISGQQPDALLFHPAPVAAGQWWRLFTHPFVHVSWYNLALDAAAFFLCYVELRERSFLDRCLTMAATGVGSLIVALLAAPAIQTHGLCGLSGIAHGLMALVSLQFLQTGNDRTLRLAGLACFLGVVGKSAIEAVTGNILCASWHLGPLGTPIAVCHAGGVLGALVIWLARRAHQPQIRSPTGSAGVPPACRKCPRRQDAGRMPALPASLTQPRLARLRE